jgi:hypothetical protein
VSSNPSTVALAIPHQSLSASGRVVLALLGPEGAGGIAVQIDGSGTVDATAVSKRNTQACVWRSQ